MASTPRIRAYVGEGEFTDDPLKTFGTRAVVRVPELQKLMRYICRNGFEHHAAMNASHTAGTLEEAFERYLGWDVYRHRPAATSPVTKITRCAMVGFVLASIP